MRIDRDTDIDGSPEPTASFSVIGVGGQFDSSVPYDTGYQMFPRFLSGLRLQRSGLRGCRERLLLPGLHLRRADRAGLYRGRRHLAGQDDGLRPESVPPPQGACCFSDGSCMETSATECSGEYQGDGTVCDPNPCVPVPTIESSWGKIKSQYGATGR
ncbi:MAG: hypothetical protein R3E12_12780 [Candidatus Eisenbacteria bacterium]